MADEPQSHPYPKDWTAHIIRVIEAITDPDQVTSKAYVDALFAMVSGALVYKGTWDASTNTPTLANTDTGKTGWFYACTVGGTVDFGAGSITFNAGDRVINNGSIWQKWDTNDLVTSVFSRVGDITAQAGDYTAGQVTNVPAGNIAAVTVQAALNELDNEKLARDGTQAMEANLDMDGNDITNVGQVVNSADIYLRSTAADVNIRLADAAGARKFIVMDSTTGEIFTINSEGLMTHEPSGAYIDKDGAVNLQNELDMSGNDILNLGQMFGNNIYISSVNDIRLRLGDNAGVQKLKILDSDSAEVAAIDSDGNLTLSGLLPDHASEHYESGNDPLDLLNDFKVNASVTSDYLTLVANGDGTASLRSPILNYGSSASEPTLGNDQLAVWEDSGTSQVWLIYKQGTGAQKKVEMASHSRYHVTDHEYGGADAIIPANIGQYGIAELDASGNVDAPPQLHSTSHENGGADEISVTGLSGLLADRQTPLSHAHDGIDGSGTVAHSDTTGQGEDDHHPRQHNLSSAADHTGQLGDSVISHQKLGAATIRTLRDSFNYFTSAGVVSGGEITDGGSATLDVAAGYGVIKSTDSLIGANFYFEWSAVTGLSTTVDSDNYVYVDYNGGSPVIGVSTTNLSNGHTIFNLGKVYREDGTLHIMSGGQRNYDLMYRVQEYLGQTQEQHRASGLIIGESGTRNVTITSGIIYRGLNPFPLASFDSSGSDTFDSWYLLNGTWTKISAQSQIDNLQYNDVSSPGSEVLANIGIAKFGVFWVYEEPDGDVQVLYGIGSYSLAEAELVSTPSQVPPLLPAHAVLVGKIIIGQNDSSFTEISSAFDTTFASTQVTNHNDLANIDGGSATERYHMTLAQHTIATTAFGGAGTPGYVPDPGSETGKFLKDDGTWATAGGTDANAIHVNVASEISGIAAKGTLADGDYLVIEDSAATNAKKSILASVLKTYAQTGIEGTAIKSTSESAGLVLTSQGDDSCDWETPKAYAPFVMTVWDTFGGALGNGTNFAVIGGDAAITSTEAYGQVRMTPCRIQALSGHISSIGTSIAFTVRKNGVATAITGTITGTGRFHITTGAPVSFADGDLISIQYTVIGGTTTVRGIALEIETELV